MELPPILGSCALRAAAAQAYPEAAPQTLTGERLPSWAELIAAAEARESQRGLAGGCINCRGSGEAKPDCASDAI
jgi:hypothetical protein